MHLFPKFKFVWGNSYINGEEELKWREQLRVCSLEIFPIYFRLTFSASELSNTQIKAILALAEDAEKFGEHLIKLANQKRLDGTTQVRAFLEQLENYPEQEIPLSSIPSIVQALFDVGEQLLCPEEESQSIFNFGNEVIISRFLWRLLPRLEEPTRFEVLKKAITQGKALAIINHETNNTKRATKSVWFRYI
jgi:predicted KAP-like P-loop ATPase